MAERQSHHGSDIRKSGDLPACETTPDGVRRAVGGIIGSRRAPLCIPVTDDGRQKGSPMPDIARTDLLVCIKCRRDANSDAGDLRPGTALFDDLITRDWPDGVRLIPTECLSNCTRGCSIALRGPGRWSYVYGNLHEVSHPDVIAEGVRAYHESTDGLVPWRSRPEHFRKNCIARIPPMEPDA